MTTKIIVIALAFTTMCGMFAMADDSKQQAGDRNAPAMNLDRCPYYPSPVICRDAPRLYDQDEMGHHADRR